MAEPTDDSIVCTVSNTTKEDSEFVNSSFVPFLCTCHEILNMRRFPSLK